MSKTKRKWWYEYCPGMISLWHKDVQHPIKTDDFLLFLIKKKVIDYSDVFPKWTKKTKDIFKPKKVDKNSNWFAGNSNTKKMLLLLFDYIKI